MLGQNVQGKPNPLCQSAMLVVTACHRTFSSQFRHQSGQFSPPSDQINTNSHANNGPVSWALFRYSSTWVDMRKGGTWSRIKYLSFCYHFEADNQRSTTEFESSQYLIWLWSYSCLKMYMPVHFVWNIETLQAHISIQYYARSAPFCEIPLWNPITMSNSDNRHIDTPAYPIP
jgi:hypothetical protein